MHEKVAALTAEGSGSLGAESGHSLSLFRFSLRADIEQSSSVSPCARTILLPPMPVPTGICSEGVASSTVESESRREGSPQAEQLV